MTAFIRHLLALVRPYRTRLALGILCGILSGTTGLLLVLTIQLVIGVLFPEAGSAALADKLNNVPEFLRAPLEGWLSHVSSGAVSASRWLTALVILLIPLVMLVRSVVSYLNIYSLEWVSVRAITDLRVRLFNHLVNLPLQFLHRTSTGELMARITNDTASMQRAINSCLPSLVRDPVQVLVLATTLLCREQTRRLTLISLVLLPAAVIPTIIYSRKVRKNARRIQDTLADLSIQMQEVFTGTRVVKAYNLETKVMEQFAAAGRRYIGLYMRVLRSLEIPGPLIEFVGGVGVAAVLFYITLVSNEPIALKNLTAFIASIFLMYQPIKALVRLQPQLVQSRAASERVFELLALENVLPEPLHPKPLRAAGAVIQFDNVDFAYDDKPILRGINLEIRPGQLVALVGRTGSGKTTITNLLLRFYDPQRGAVRIGGTDIREFATRDLRSQIALVTQETILFNDTIGRNIALGRPGATDAEIEAAAKHAYAHEFIRERPQGYDAIVGEKGVSVSGGQRQRIAIARAIVKDAPILVLDEATNALDAESERAVQTALEKLMEGRTTICIAHRLSTIQRADSIVVLDQGRIVEIGTHAELITARGIYWKLYELQFEQPAE